MGTRSFNDFASKLNFGAGETPKQPEPQGIGKQLAMFNPFGAGQSSQSDAENPQGEEGASLMDRGASAMQNLAGKAKGTLANTKKKIQEVPIISKEQWMIFVTLLGIGSFLMLLAFAFLPMVVLQPQKFALLFTIGSVCYMSSFGALKGTTAYLKHLFVWKRAPFTLAYLVSMVGTLWASLIARSYLLTIGFSAVQVVALAYFLVSYIPGGTKVLTWFGNAGCGIVKKLCGCNKGSSVPLPL